MKRKLVIEDLNAFEQKKKKKTCDLSRLCKQMINKNIIQYGNFILKSGEHSKIYFDMRKIISYPILMNDICDSIYSMIKTRNTSIVGVPLGSIPIAANISARHNLPMLMLRNEVKTYGMKKLVEGDSVNNKSCVVVEDVTTTGGNVLDAVLKLESDGFKIIQILIILDREQGAPEMLREFGYTVDVLFNMSDFI